ncbi:MAG: hypothetical protein KGZ37_04310 [Nitrosarchaeum sp.]|nr:hypothetical protein [Nitrosarchaeum sp.]
MTLDQVFTILTETEKELQSTLHLNPEDYRDDNDYDVLSTFLNDQYTARLRAKFRDNGIDESTLSNESQSTISVHQNAFVLRNLSAAGQRDNDSDSE